MLRVNLIGQRMAEERQAQQAWLVCLVLCLILGVGTFAICGAGTWRVISKNSEIARYQQRIEQTQQAADEAAALKRQTEVLKPVADLATEVQGSAGRWGVLLHDITVAVPDRGGYWLESIETKFDDKTYRQTATLKGWAQRQELVGELTGHLTERSDSIDPERVTVPSVELQVDERGGTQKVGFTIDASLRKPIGEDYQ